jgi:hypothetical protein
MKARLPQGYGKQSQQQLMQQVQQMQENMRLKQEELENTEYSVTSGGGMVELKMTAAVNEAVRVVDEASEKEMGALTGGLNIPGLGL